MRKFKFESNYGNFAYRMTAEINPDVLRETFIDENSTREDHAAALALKTLVWLVEEQGIANLCYRTVGSNVDKALGVKSAKQGGKGRTGVLYSESDAETINAAVSAKIRELESDAKFGGYYKALNLSFAVTGQHTFGQGAKPSKEAEELWTSVQGMDEAGFAAACKNLGIDPENYDDETGVAACHKFLVEEKRKAAASALGKLGITAK